MMGGETVQHKPYRHLFEIYPSGRGGGPASGLGSRSVRAPSRLLRPSRRYACTTPHRAGSTRHLIRQERWISSTSPYGLDSCVCACEMRNVCAVVNLAMTSPALSAAAHHPSGRVVSCRVSGAGVGCIPSHDRILATLSVLTHAHPGRAPAGKSRARCI